MLTRTYQPNKQTLTNKQTSKLQIITGLVIVGFLATATAVATSSQDAALPVQTVVTETLDLPSAPQATEQAAAITRHERVQRGDTLTAILARLGVADSSFQRYVKSNKDAARLLSLKPGRIVAVTVDDVGRVQRFDVIVEQGKLTAARLSVTATINEAGAVAYTASQADVPMDRKVETRSTEIRSSLFAATDGAGIPESVAIQVAEIFGGDIDFDRDLRKGDTLRVVYESLRIADALDSAVAGRVLAVEFVNKGKRYDAVWFDKHADAAATGDERGEYYSPSGNSFKKAFLRSPLEFSRLTSGFSLARLHPISRKWGAHKGVDFAAPIGTNIRASGSGVVDFVGQQNGYGNVVILKHGKKYETLYAHMNEFADGLKVGKKISQGDVIGTVGTTGWSTGPHLHYEFKVDGEHVDPMSAALPLAEPLVGHEQKRFSQASLVYSKKMAAAQSVRIAKFE